MALVKGMFSMVNYLSFSSSSRSAPRGGIDFRTELGPELATRWLPKFEERTDPSFIYSFDSIFVMRTSAHP